VFVLRARAAQHHPAAALPLAEPARQAEPAQGAAGLHARGRQRGARGGADPEEVPVPPQHGQVAVLHAAAGRVG
jgi:hypothetical protein